MNIKERVIYRLLLEGLAKTKWEAQEVINQMVKLGKDRQFQFLWELNSESSPGVTDLVYGAVKDHVQTQADILSWPLVDAAELCSKLSYSQVFK